MFHGKKQQISVKIFTLTYFVNSKAHNVLQICIIIYDMYTQIFITVNSKNDMLS